MSDAWPATRTSDWPLKRGGAQLAAVQQRSKTRSVVCLTVPDVSVYSGMSGFYYTHCGKVFELIDRRFAIHRPLQESLVGRRHENEENATEIRNLHRGGAECQAGGGDTSSVPEA